jgi:hypothetical protein
MNSDDEDNSGKGLSDDEGEEEEDFIPQDFIPHASEK